MVSILGDKKGTKILVKGDPGIGKSTFVNKLLYDWAMDIFVTFSLIFTISLKLVGPNDPIENMIIEQSLPLVDANVKPSIIKALLKQHEKVLLILDGYDEMSESARESPYLKRLLQSALYGDICLVMTSRPQMITDIEGYFTSIASIEGFSREKAEQFVSKFFPDDQETVQAIMDFTGRSGIRDMWRIPILLLFICVLVESRLLDISPSANVAMNTIYENLIECVFRRHLAKKGKVIGKKELERLMQGIVIKFGQIAFECLGDDSNLCKASDIKDLVGPEAFEYGLIIGAVDRTMFLCDHDDVKVSFLHRSLQEYLAACFVVNKILTDGCHLEDVLLDKMKQDPLGKYMLFSSFLNEIMSNKISVSSSVHTVEEKAKGERPADNDTVAIQDQEGNLKSSQNTVIMNEQKMLLDIAQESLAGKENMVVAGYAVTPASSYFVMNVLKGNKSLVSLTFDNLDLSHCLTQLFACQLPLLQGIKFRKCTFKESQEVTDAFHFSTNPFPSVQWFCLDTCTGLSNHVANIFGNLLRQCNKLLTIAIITCNLQDFLTPLLRGTHKALNKLFLENTKIQESADSTSKVFISMERLHGVRIHQCTLDIHAYRLLGKCMSTSKEGVALDVQCEEAKGLDPALFGGEFKAVDKIEFSFGHTKHKYHFDTTPLDTLKTMMPAPKLSSVVLYGSLPTVSEITFSDMVLLPDVMQNLALSLQHCQVPLSLVFNGCDIIDGMIFLGHKGLPTMQKLKFNSTNIIDRAIGQEKIQIGGFASLQTVLNKTNCRRTRHLIHKIWGSDDRFNSYDPHEVCGHISSNSVGILSKCISQSIKLTVLRMPMTGEAVQILVSNDLPSVVIMELYVRQNAEEQGGLESTSRSSNSRASCSKRFECLQILNLFPDREYVPLKTFDEQHPTTCTTVPLRHEGWKQLFLSLAGSRSLEKCYFDLVDLTGLLELFLSETLHSLSSLVFTYCEIKENLTDFSSYRGNLPSILKFELDLSPLFIMDNCALRLLCTCLAGSRVLNEFSVNYQLDAHGIGIYHEHVNHLVSGPQINFKGCLSALFQMPLPRLQKLTFSSCILDEDPHNNIQCTHTFLPSLVYIKLEKDTEISNSAMKVLSNVLAGNLSPFLCFDNVDCTGCLSILLSKEYPNLEYLTLHGCILGEENTSQLANLCGNISRVPNLDFTTCKYVSNTAAQILFASFGGSQNLTSLGFSYTDLTGCLPLLLIGRMNKLSELVLKGCTLSEDTMDQHVTGYLPALVELKLRNCKRVSPVAAGLLFWAVSGSHKLVSIDIAKVELSTLTTVLFVHDLPNLTHFTLEYCALSSKQVNSFIQCRKDGFFVALRFLYLNGTRGVSGWFSHKADQDLASFQAIEKGGFALACRGLWVLTVRECGLTKPDIEGLHTATEHVG